MIIVNPTGKPVRSDAWGDGRYGARRKRNDGTTYAHKGVDFTCVPKQNVVAPITAVYKRIAYPYADSREYAGALFEAEWCEYKMFYYRPTIEPGQIVEASCTVGKAQDISKRYGPDCKMVPHVHFEIVRVFFVPEDVKFLVGIGEMLNAKIR